MSECSGGREQSEQCRASERVSSASKRANGQASGPVHLNYCLFWTIAEQRKKDKKFLMIEEEKARPLGSKKWETMIIRERQIE